MNNKKVISCLILIISFFSLTSCVSTFKEAFHVDVIFDDTQTIQDIRDSFDREYGLGEQVNITSFDNIKINASIYKNEGSHKYFVGTYGLGSSKKYVLPLGVYFFNNGYNFINYDIRSCGDSTGLFLGLGSLDAKDMLCVIDYVISIDPLAQIVVSGQSITGLATLLASSQMPKNVKCMVVDSGFVNLREAANTVTNNKLPLLLDIANIPFSLIYGKSADKVDACESLKNNTTPLFYVVGEKDVFVLPSEIEKIKSLFREDVPIKTLLVPQAPHARSFEYDYQNYACSIFDFCESFIK